MSCTELRPKGHGSTEHGLEADGVAVLEQGCRGVLPSHGCAAEECSSHGRGCQGALPRSTPQELRMAIEAFVTRTGCQGVLASKSV